MVRLIEVLEKGDISDFFRLLRATKLNKSQTRSLRLLVADFAEHKLHAFEDHFSNDKRPREAIQATRDYANGLISTQQLEQASCQAGRTLSSIDLNSGCDAISGARASYYASNYDPAWAVTYISNTSTIDENEWLKERLGSLLLDWESRQSRFSIDWCTIISVTVGTLSVIAGMSFLVAI